MFLRTRLIWGECLDGFGNEAIAALVGSFWTDPDQGDPDLIWSAESGKTIALYAETTEPKAR